MPYAKGAANVQRGAWSVSCTSVAYFDGLALPKSAPKWPKSAVCPKINRKQNKKKKMKYTNCRIIQTGCSLA